MRLIAGVWMICLGYTVLYYGVAMWQQYTMSADDRGIERAIPMVILLGLAKPGKVNSAKHPTPPFNLGGSIYGNTAHTSALQKNGPTIPTQTGGTML